MPSFRISYSGRRPSAIVLRLQQIGDHIHGEPLILNSHLDVDQVGHLLALGIDQSVILIYLLGVLTASDDRSQYTSPVGDQDIGRAAQDGAEDLLPSALLARVFLRLFIRN